MHHLQGMLIFCWVRGRHCEKPEESLKCGVSILAGTRALSACLSMLLYVFSWSLPQISFLVPPSSCVFCCEEFFILGGKSQSVRKDCFCLRGSCMFYRWWYPRMSSFHLGESSGFGQGTFLELVYFSMSYAWHAPVVVEITYKYLCALVDNMIQILAKASSRQAGRLWALPDVQLGSQCIKVLVSHTWCPECDPWDTVEGENLLLQFILTFTCTFWHIHVPLPISINEM